MHLTEFDSGVAAAAVGPGPAGESGPDGSDTTAELFAESATRPPQFHSRVTRLELDHVTIGTFTAAQHAGSRAAKPQRGPGRRTLTAAVLTKGETTVRRGDESVVLHPGSVLVFSSDMDLRYVTAGTIRLVQLTMGDEHLPPHLLDRNSLSLEALSNSRLVRSFSALLQQLCAASPDPATGAPHLGNALVGLLLALVAQAMNESADEREGDGLRHRIGRYIDRNMIEPGLGSSSIASAMGVSVRHVRLAVSSPDVTVGRFIQNRRLDGVALALDSDTQPGRVGALSTRFGFGGRDQLPRAFRVRYGMTLREYSGRARSD